MVFPTYAAVLKPVDGGHISGAAKVLMQPPVDPGATTMKPAQVEANEGGLGMSRCHGQAPTHRPQGKSLMTRLTTA